MYVQVITLQKSFTLTIPSLDHTYEILEPSFHDILGQNTIECRKVLTNMNGQNRKNIKPGIEVDIVLKQDQRTGKLTRGTVKDILTKSSSHPHGIKVRLQDGQVGRVKEIINTEES